MTARSRRVRQCVAALLMPLAFAAACAVPVTPDIVLLNARVFTGVPDRPWAEALAIRGDRIIAVGTTAEISPLAAEQTASRDLGGRTVVPGFNDAHVDDPGGEPSDLAAFARAAVSSGITSMQWFVGGRSVREAGQALLAADPPLRLRLFRMPRPGPGDTTIDSRPHLPPQPSLRLDIRGMGFVLGGGDEARIRQATGWGYGTEDLIAVEPADEQALMVYVDAVERTGTPEVWKRKRPRLERPLPNAADLASRMAASGMVAVQRPGGNVPLASLVRAGVTLALGSGRGSRPFDVLLWATAPERGGEALTMEEAVGAFTRGSAYAEFSDRDKGHLQVAALADLAVLSADPFTGSRDELSRARSLLTIIGGRVVHDVP